MLGNLIGGLIKQKPKVPEFKPIDVQAEQANAIKANQANFGAASQLAETYNAFSQDQLMKAIEGVVPNAREILDSTSKNIASMSRGELPEDVARQVERRAAAKSFGSGTGGSGFGRNLTTRDLGLTSLQLTQQGFDNATRWLATARQALTAPQMDVSAMFVTPAQQINVASSNEQARWQTKWMNNQLDSRYHWTTVVGNTLEQEDAFIKGIVTQVAGSVAGGAGGGGGAMAGI